MVSEENLADEFLKDPISQEQANLVSKQEIVSSEMSGFTPAQVQQIANVVQAQMTNVTGNIAGLQSKIDRGLNSIRTDSMAATRQNVKQELDMLLQSQELDEAQLSRLRQLRVSEQQIDQQLGLAILDNFDSQANYAQQPTQNDDLAGARAMAQERGIHPYDQRIDYGVLYAPGLDSTEKLRRFTDSLMAISNSNASASVAQPPMPQQQAQPRTANPPVEPGPAQSTSFSNEMEVMDAYISGAINGQERDQRLKSLGSDLKF